MEAMDQMLVLRDNAKAQLMQIQSVEDGISYLNKLSAIDKWVKAEKKDAELQNIVAEQKIRTQRILGELIKEGQRKGLVASKETFHGNRFVECEDAEHSTLDKIGITRKQSSTFQQIASIPEETFEEFIQEKKQKVNDAVSELTTTGAVRLAKSLKNMDNDFDSIQEADRELEINRELRELAKNINSTYNKEQRNLLKSLIK
jgi:hypothetical protein